MPKAIDAQDDITVKDKLTNVYFEFGGQKYMVHISEQDELEIFSLKGAQIIKIRPIAVNHIALKAERD